MLKCQTCLDHWVDIHKTFYDKFLRSLELQHEF
jgi:hypothetical protein